MFLCVYVRTQVRKLVLTAPGWAADDEVCVCVWVCVRDTQVYLSFFTSGSEQVYAYLNCF